MELFYNYLLQGKQMSPSFDIDNRLDPDVDGCYELYKDYATLVMGTELSKYFKLEVVAKQYEETLYPNQTLRSTWDKFEKMYKGNVKYKGRGKLTAPRFLIKLSDPKGTHNSYLLSTDYFGPSVASAKYHGMSEEAQRHILDRCKILGGHIAWPVHLRSISVNVARGGREGFYDRVDLTLEAVKRFYGTETIDEYKEVTRDVASCNIKSKWGQERYTSGFTRVGEALYGAKGLLKDVFLSFRNFCRIHCLYGSFVSVNDNIVEMSDMYNFNAENYEEYTSMVTSAVSIRTRLIHSRHDKERVFKN